MVMPELPATTHLSIVDGQAMPSPQPVRSRPALGSRIQVDGFNNQLTDFSFTSEREGKPVANRAEPGKRPLSWMAPTPVFDAGRLHAVLGSLGGSRIINYVARTLQALLDGGMEPMAALAMGHAGNRNGATLEVERGRVGDDLVQELEKARSCGPSARK